MHKGQIILHCWLKKGFSQIVCMYCNSILFSPPKTSLFFAHYRCVDVVSRSWLKHEFKGSDASECSHWFTKRKLVNAKISQCCFVWAWLVFKKYIFLTDLSSELFNCTTLHRPITSPTSTAHFWCCVCSVAWSCPWSGLMVHTTGRGLGSQILPCAVSSKHTCNYVALASPG